MWKFRRHRVQYTRENKKVRKWRLWISLKKWKMTNKKLQTIRHKKKKKESRVPKTCRWTHANGQGVVTEVIGILTGHKKYYMTKEKYFFFVSNRSCYIFFLLLLHHSVAHYITGLTLPYFVNITEHKIWHKRYHLRLRDTMDLHSLLVYLLIII